MKSDSSVTLWLAAGIIIAYQALYRCFLHRAKKERRIFMLKRSAMSLLYYFPAVALLRKTNVPIIPAVILSALSALAFAQLIVRRNRKASDITPPS